MNDEKTTTKIPNAVMKAVPKDLVRNITRSAVLHQTPRFAVSTVEQVRGLMFKRPAAGDCLIFLFLPARKVRFHMWFVFGSIDIIALDGKGVVIALKERFAPWMFWSPGVNASAVIELPVGTIARTKTAIGDKIAFPTPDLCRSSGMR
jgi:uncharacterized protein